MPDHAENQIVQSLDQAEMTNPSTYNFDKGRLQSLSDGVFAIVMTLLVLNLIGDEVLGAKSAGELHSVLLELWPKIISYVISFAVAARYWVAQHVMMHHVAHTDLRFIWLNILFLFWISWLPFSAALLGEHHQYAVGEIVYGVNMILIIVSMSPSALAGVMRYMTIDSSPRTWMRISLKKSAEDFWLPPSSMFWAS